MKGLASTLRAGGSLAVLLWAGSITLPAQAASFHCSANSSYSEKAVCGNVYLSFLDDKLNAAYKEALNVTPDRQSLEDARTQQWQWRQANCKTQACVTDWYERRISELDADVVQGKKAQRVAFEQHLDAQKLTPDAASAIRELKLGTVPSSASVKEADTAATLAAVKAPPAVPRTEQSPDFTLNHIAVHNTSGKKQTEAAVAPKAEVKHAPTAAAVDTKDVQASGKDAHAVATKVSASAVTEMMKPVPVAAHATANSGVTPIPNVITNASK